MASAVMSVAAQVRYSAFAASIWRCRAGSEVRRMASGWSMAPLRFWVRGDALPVVVVVVVVVASRGAT